ncbi:MAG: hypothetical protein B7X11_04325, partial [Acidobacteria bacterium 37-65-4]
MAVMVVGDVDRDAVTAMIKDHFSSLSSPSPERPRPAFDVPDHPATRYAIVTDKETTQTTVEISDLRPARNQGSVGGYREIMLDQLFASMLGARLDELSASAAPPFLAAGADRALFPTARTRGEAILQALVSNNGVARGLDALVTELHRVAEFGFTATELARAKQAMMRNTERMVTEGPDRESASRADEYTRNFLEDEALPTIWQELAFHRRFDPGITLAEVNALTRDWFPDKNRLVVVSAPDAADVVLPDLAITGTPTEAFAVKVAAYGIGMALLGPVAWAAAGAVGVHSGVELPALGVLVLGALGVATPFIDLHQAATRRRRHFCHSLSTYASLVSMAMAGAMGWSSALEVASTVSSTDWAMREIAQSLLWAQAYRKQPWEGLERLAVRFDIPEDEASRAAA